MNGNSKKHHNQIEIIDLIAEAVSSAAERRNEALDLEASLSVLSDEQAKSLCGGIDRIGDKILGLPPIVCGMFPVKMSGSFDSVER